MKEGRSRKRKRARHPQPLNQQSLKSKHKTTTSTTELNKDDNQTSSSAKRPKPSTSFLDEMRARLSGGHFRMLNEKLYTCTWKEALNYFGEDPALFDMYHGYQEQMSHWPELPVNIITKWLKGHSPSLVVADFGCGKATLIRI